MSDSDGADALAYAFGLAGGGFSPAREGEWFLLNTGRRARACVSATIDGSPVAAVLFGPAQPTLRLDPGFSRFDRLAPKEPDAFEVLCR